MTISPTRDRIIEVADDLFYKSGFDATSFADVAAAVGIPRGNFYHHFKTKDAILEAVIKRRMERTRALLGRWEMEASDPFERVLSFIRTLLTHQAEIMAFGCPNGTLCSELAKFGHVAHGRAVEILRQFREWLAEQFRALGAGDRADVLAMRLLSWSQGVSVMATAFRNATFIRDEVAEVEMWLMTWANPSSRSQQKFPELCHPL